MNTYLSKNVYHLVQNIGDCFKNNYFVNKNAINEDLTFNWSQIADLFSECIDDDFNIHDQNFNWFESKIKNCYPIWAEAHSKLYDYKNVSTLLELCKWTNRIEDIKDYFDGFQNSIQTRNTRCMEGILLLSSIFERAVGNVYLLKGKKVPFLLRDLLNTKEVKSIFGVTPIIFAQILIGTPKALNLRNLCWHGFPTINELHPCYISTLFLLIASFGQILLVKEISFDIIPYRSQIKNLCISTDKIIEVAQFPKICDYDREISNVLKLCHFIGEMYLEYWNTIFEYFNERKFGKCMSLFLPLFEHLMRRIFCYINDCESQLVTAESDTLYTTLDEIFSEHLGNNRNVNKIYTVFEVGFLELYHDLFTHHAGLRIRDKFSHGEIDFYDVPITTMNILLWLALIAIVEFSELKTNKSYLTEITSSICASYKSRFHTNAIVKEKIILIHSNLKHWPFTSPYVEKNWNEFQQRYDKLIEVIQMFNKHNKKIFLNSTELKSENQLLKYYKIPTINRPAQEVQITTIFKQILDKIIITDINVQSNLEIKYKLFLTHKLRTQQRQSYNNMLNGVPVLHLGLFCILQVIIYEMNIILQSSDITFVDTKYIKYLKRILQYVENMASLTEISKNKWDLIINQTEELVILINNHKKSCSV